jgi:hypothetical protein
MLFNNETSVQGCSSSAITKQVKYVYLCCMSAGHDELAHGCAVHKAELCSLRTAFLVAATAISQFRARIFILRHMETDTDKNVGSNVDFPKSAILSCRKILLADVVSARPQFSLATFLFMARCCAAIRQAPWTVGSVAWFVLSSSWSKISLPTVKRLASCSSHRR